MAADITSTQTTLPSSSSELDTSFSYGSTKATVAKQPEPGIEPTKTLSSSSQHNTETLKLESLQPSVKLEPSTSSQFAMQHATQSLPSNDVTMATTSYTSGDSSVDQKSQTVTVGVTSDSPITSSVSIATKATSVPKSVQPSATVSASKHLQSSSSSVASGDSVTSKYEPSVSETVSATSSQAAGQSVSVGLTPSSSTASLPSGSSVKSLSVTSDYAATSRELYTTMTPSKTEFIPSGSSTGSFRTTPVASLTMTPSVKPVTTDGGGSSPLFGGGTNDILLYVAIPLCGVGLLIFLVICIVCIRKRKAKQKGSPGRHPVPDLWVNANAEVPLGPIDQHDNVNSREVFGGHRLSAVRKRNKSKVKEQDLVSKCNQKEADVSHVTRSESQKEATRRGLIVRDIQGEPVSLVGDDDVSDDVIDDVSGTCSDENDGDENGEYSRPDSAGGCVTYEAVYDFPGALETHLSLHQGDVVNVHRKEDNGWWRGTAGDRTGWFPNSYVQAVLHDYVEEENEMDPQGELNISSFMTKKPDGGNRNSYPTEEEIQAEPVYCKIQPKSRRKSEPKSDEKSVEKPPQINRENTPIPIDEGTKFVALYAYGAQLKGEISLEKGDILLGKEKDRNGWMHGVKETNGLEGWFPAVYVDELPKQEESTSNEVKTKAEPDPKAYQHLEANKTQNNNKDWVGILHKAIHDFTGEKAGDLPFSAGETVTVFQILENGWWLGSKDEVVGWFPGSYVEMVGHQSPKPKDEESIQPTIQTENEPQVSDKVNPPVKNTNRLRPTRKAPPPPDSIPNAPAETKLPEISRPSRKAPPPPTTPRKTVEKETVDLNDDPLYDVIGKIPDQFDKSTVGTNEILNDSAEKKSEIPLRPKREKPKLPVRYVKPKIITVPRDQINFPAIHSGQQTSTHQISRPQAPPPPRPSPPKFVKDHKFPARKESLEHSLSETEEDESFFNISPQRKFDTQLKRQDSSDVEETQPYRSLSSFGSTFSKKETVSPSASNSEGINRAQSNAKSTGIPKLSRQTVVEDDNSLPRNVIVHEEFKEEAEINSQSCDLDINEEKMGDVIESPHIDDSVLKEYDIIKTPERGDIGDSNKMSTVPLDTNGVKLPESESQNGSIRTPNTHNVSKIPKHPGSDSGSRIPMSPSAKKQSNTNREENVSPATANAMLQETLDEVKVKENGDISLEEQNTENNPSINAKLDNAIVSVPAVNGDLSDSDRPRINSIDKPPVAPKPKPSGLPKVLPKPKANVKAQSKGPEEINDLEHKHGENISKSEKPRQNSPQLGNEENNNLSEDTKVSKIPQGSKIAQKSPASKGKLSKIPASPKVARKVVENKDSPTSPSATETEKQSVNLKQKPESPAGTRRQIPRHRTFSNESPSLRNRSNSPHARTAIPSSPNVRNRSNSPASKLAKPSGIPSHTGIPISNAKPSGLPKKQHKQDSIDKTEKHSPVTAKPPTPVGVGGFAVTGESDTQSGDELENDSKPSRPSKPPRVQKQKSADSKIPKQGKSLLPLVHKSMDAGSSGAGSSGKPKSGIPMARPPRPPQPKTQEHHHDNEILHENGSAAGKKTLYQAVKGYTAQCDGELTFSEGTFIKELSDCDRPGWYVGMLADGTTGIYPADHLKPSPVTAQSEA